MSEMRLELIPVPVADVERARAFYVDRMGFGTDHDLSPADGVRILQLTPPGSGCSILVSSGLSAVAMAAGSLRGLHLVVADLHKTRAELAGRGVAISQVEEQGGVLFAHLADPDGNTWVLQEIP